MEYSEVCKIIIKWIFRITKLLSSISTIYPHPLELSENRDHLSVLAVKDAAFVMVNTSVGLQNNI